MSDTDKEYIAPAPFLVFDAIAETYFAGVNASNPNMHTRRVNCTAGSALYEVNTIRKRPIGSIFIRAAEDDKTYILITAHNDDKQSTPQLRLIEIILSGMWAHYQGLMRQDRLLPSIETIPYQEEFAAIYADIPDAPAEPTRPQPGDSIDVWLDWRAAERKRRRRWTLDYIAKESGFSISTVKKHSSERKPRGTK